MISQLTDIQAEENNFFLFKFYSDTQWIGWGPSTWGRTICFMQTTNSDVNLIQKHPYRHTQNNVLPSIWAPHGPVRWTEDINHHRGGVRGWKRWWLLETNKQTGARDLLWCNSAICQLLWLLHKATHVIKWNHSQQTHCMYQSQLPVFHFALQLQTIGKN